MVIQRLEVLCCAELYAKPNSLERTFPSDQPGVRFDQKYSAENQSISAQEKIVWRAFAIASIGGAPDLSLHPNIQGRASIGESTRSQLVANSLFAGIRGSIG